MKKIILTLCLFSSLISFAEDRFYKTQELAAEEAVRSSSQYQDMLSGGDLCISDYKKFLFEAGSFQKAISAERDIVEAVTSLSGSPLEGKILVKVHNFCEAEEHKLFTVLVKMNHSRLMGEEDIYEAVGFPESR